MRKTQKVKKKALKRAKFSIGADKRLRLKSEIAMHLRRVLRLPASGSTWTGGRQYDVSAEGLAEQLVDIVVKVLGS